MILVNRNHTSLAQSHYEGCIIHVKKVKKIYSKAFRLLRANPNLTLNNLLASFASETYFIERSINAYLAKLYSPHGRVLKPYYRANITSFIAFLKALTEDVLKKIITTPFYTLEDLRTINTFWINRIAVSYPTFLSTSPRAIYDAHFLAVFNNILDYDTFVKSGFWNKTKTIKWDAYKLSTALDVRVCPYCNRNFTLTVKRDRTSTNDKTKICRPQFDHLLSKSNNIFLVLSYYNLIPSCSTCNHIKTDNIVDLDNFMHPYFSAFSNTDKFTIRPLSAGSSYGVNSDYEFDFHSTNPKAIANNEVFYLKEIYHKHSDYICDLIERIRMANPVLMDHIKQHYTDIGIPITDKKIEDFLFPEIKDDLDFNKYPLSKFLKDIYLEYKILNPK